MKSEITLLTKRAHPTTILGHGTQHQKKNIFYAKPLHSTPLLHRYTLNHATEQKSYNCEKFARLTIPNTNLTIV